MRVFIAVELDDYIKKYIANIQKNVKEYTLKGNFTHLNNFHLTLRFIGEVEEAEIVKLKDAIDQTTLEIKPFTIRLGNLGCFPKKTKKILWLGLSEGEQYIRSLFLKLENNLEKKGYAREERGIKPHITIGREVRLKTDFNNICDILNVDEKQISISQISLMESKRVEGELRYMPTYISDMKL